VDREGGQGEEKETFYPRVDHWEAKGSQGGAICYNLTVITGPKTSHIQIIPGISTPEPITFASGKLAELDMGFCGRLALGLFFI
jgi:hypothetical protein